jgi:site-specific DNA-cytosine methylase
LYRAVDCQGFAGGFTLGMVQAGFTLVGKREMKGGFGVANCEANRHLLGTQWRSEAVDPEQWSAPDADVVFGNPPCSGFSVMSSPAFRGADSKINHCMWAFVEFASRVRPQIAVFESVQNAFTSTDGHVLMRRLREDLETRTGLRYTLHHVRHNAIAVGGAAVRRRYFWLVSQVPFGVERPRLPQYPVLNDVIGDLAPLSLTWQKQPYRAPASWWATTRLSGDGAVDGHVGLDNPLTRRIADLLDNIDWPAGVAIGEACRLHWDEHGKLPDSFAGLEEKIVKNDFQMGFTTPTRWAGDRYGRVVTGGGLHNVIHPFLKRNITHREAARILGFPDDWRILPLRRTPALNITWGKGITVDCGRWIGDWIRAALDGTPGSFGGTEIGEREYDIDTTNDYPRGVTTTSLPTTLITSRGSRPHGTWYSESSRKKVKSQEGAAMTEAAEPTRGRPRPDAVIERDKAVLAFVQSKPEGVTRPEIVEGTGLQGNQVYLSLYRLSRATPPAVTKSGAKWVPTAPAEAAVAA